MKWLLYLSWGFYLFLGFVLLDCALGQYKLVEDGDDPFVQAAYYRTSLPLSQIDIKWYDGGTHAVVYWHDKLIYAAKG